MRFTVEYPDPKFKVGDFIAMPCGPADRPKTVVVFAVCAIHLSGMFAYAAEQQYPTGKAGVVPHTIKGLYYLACQEDIASPDTGREWMYKRQITTPEIEDVDATAELVKWDLPLLPLADLEFLKAKYRNHT